MDPNQLPSVNVEVNGQAAALLVKLMGDLKTEHPRPARIAAAVRRVLADPTYLASVRRVAAELRALRPVDTIVAAILSDANERALAVQDKSGARASQSAH